MTKTTDRSRGINRRLPMSAILTAEKAKAIILRAIEGTTSTELATEYGVADSTIRNILRGQGWAKHTVEERKAYRAKYGTYEPRCSPSSIPNKTARAVSRVPSSAAWVMVYGPDDDDDRYED
jgi:hypothetical protein